VLVGGGVAVAQTTIELLRGVLTFGGPVPAAYYLTYPIVSVLAAYFVYRLRAARGAFARRPRFAQRLLATLLS
jgi:ABC-type Na+ efflux pump permease subunit